MRTLKQLISNITDWLLYSVLSEEQKQKITNLFSEKQKERLRQLTQYGKRRKQKLYVKQIKDNIYSLGFRDQGTRQLKTILHETNDTYLKRLVAWELVLFYANLETEYGAKEALQYIEDAKNGEKDLNQKRRISIIEAECLQKIGEKDEARNRIETQLNVQNHPDLYLALANLEDNIEHRFHYINNVYEQEGLNPITFSNKDNPTYDTLRMAKTSEPIERKEKISVLLPAYNAGEGLRTAVESILSQTWRNLELIIVDDCSTDETLEIAKSYEAKDERVIVRQTERNSGPYVARNIALSIATGDFVTVNDADDWSHEQKLATQALHLIENPHIIANTSGHARLTEDLFFYRRGTPGRYIFPNMSSIMFRREKVMKNLGYWDSVRFAADGEFKRRLLRAFGDQAFVDLDTGPLSLPRQAVASLTTSSAFGYNGFFMGARKEFVESFTHYYESAGNLYYPFPMKKRLYPVPEPMWPQREAKEDGFRKFDYVIATDFRGRTNEGFTHIDTVKQVTQEKGLRIGFMQLYEFDLEKPIEIAKNVRDFMAERGIQMLVYGEKINTEKLLIIDYNGLLDEQTYIPEIKAKDVFILLDETVVPNELIAIDTQFKKEYHKTPIFVPFDQKVRQKIVTQYNGELPFELAKKDWV